MIKTIKYLSLIILLTACSKNSSEEHVLTGRLMQSCDSPAANRDGIIHFSGGGILNKPSTSLEFTTDENGYFKVTHDRRFTEFSVRTSANHSVLEVNSIQNDENDLGEVYINHFPTNFVIKLDVKSQYTENDTLVLKDFGNTDPFAQRLISGPFESGFLDSVVNASYDVFPIKLSEIENNGGPRYSVVYILNDASYVKSAYFNLSPICSGEFAEVTLVIE